MAPEEIDQAFTHHPPFGDQPQRYLEIRQRAKELAHLINGTTPVSREQSVALTKLREAVMWANAAIAINEQPPEPQL